MDYDVKSAIFKICFDDGKIERLDAVNLKEILITDKTKGDAVEKHLKTGQEVVREEIKRALMAEMCEKYVYNSIPSCYGECDAKLTDNEQKKTVKKVVIRDTSEKNILCIYGKRIRIATSENTKYSTLPRKRSNLRQRSAKK